MNEFLKRAQRIADENRAVEQECSARTPEQHAWLESRRTISDQRAKDFVGIMRDHNIEMIALCHEGNYNRIPIWQRFKHQFKHEDMGTAVGSSGRRLREAQGRKITEVRLGWIAAQDYRIDHYDQTFTNVPGIFVSKTAETFLYSRQGVSRGTQYVVPLGSEKVGGLDVAPDEGILAPEDAMQRVVQMLVHQYGIKR